MTRYTERDAQGKPPVFLVLSVLRIHFVLHRVTLGGEAILRSARLRGETQRMETSDGQGQEVLTGGGSKRGAKRKRAV